MKYTALLRGINVGGNNKVEMKKLKTVFEALAYTNVSTYINTGNVIFESQETADQIHKKLGPVLKKEFGFEVPMLVKTEKEIKRIANAIPKEWQNDSTHRTDVAYLFPELDFETTIDKLPVKKEFMDLRYVEGAIFWNMKRENVTKSQLNKLIGHKMYKLMTIRNVNTARHLAAA